MIRELPAGGYAFVDRFLGVRNPGIKFDIEPLFHGPDDQEAYPAVKNDAVGHCTDDDLGPVRHLR